MNKVQRSQAFLRKRKMMMVLPLLVIPFLTMAFWTLGGGKGTEVKVITTQQRGLNLQLPSANLKDDAMADKMSFYDQADKDSIKLAEEMRNDPYYRNQDSMRQVYNNELEQLTQQSAEKFNQSTIIQSGGLKTSPYDKSGIPAEEKVMKKLAELNKAINQPDPEQLSKDTEEYVQGNGDYSFGSDVDRLENMMNLMNKDTNNDPEMMQLDNTLEKILDIQHPERIKERIKENSLLHNEAVYPVSTIARKESVSLLDTGKEKKSASGFFGLEGQESLSEENNSIEAVVHETQTLVNGAVVKLRLLNDVYIKGALIPKGTFAFGTASLAGERLEVEINSIRYNQSLYPVKLIVFDIDGLPGIYIPGAITRDVAKQSADNSLQLMELTTLDPSLKAQATAAGISAAKGLLSRKVKQVKVLVKAGYKVLLKDKNTEQ
ncbi:MAG TPA: conjugative transposon protein TraM [Chitinophagaceae bacterium]|nr:conjugative transposon protein TraM [Chitinophagaceae bacterium]